MLGVSDGRHRGEVGIGGADGAECVLDNSELVAAHELRMEERFGRFVTFSAHAQHLTVCTHRRTAQRQTIKTAAAAKSTNGMDATEWDASLYPASRT